MTDQQLGPCAHLPYLSDRECMVYGCPGWTTKRQAIIDASVALRDQFDRDRMGLISTYNAKSAEPFIAAFYEATRPEHGLEATSQCNWFLPNGERCPNTTTGENVLCPLHRLPKCDDATDKCTYHRGPNYCPVHVHGLPATPLDHPIVTGCTHAGPCTDRCEPIREERFVEGGATTARCLECDVTLTNRPGSTEDETRVCKCGKTLRVPPRRMLDERLPARGQEGQP